MTGQEASLGLTASSTSVLSGTGETEGLGEIWGLS